MLSKTFTEHDNLIKNITEETARRIPEIIPHGLKEIILFGSYARGDYTEESDIDIAVLVSCDRNDTKKYRDRLVAFSAELDLENMVVVNFVCLSYDEFNEKKAYYPFFMNIDVEGKSIYGK